MKNHNKVLLFSVLFVCMIIFGLLVQSCAPSIANRSVSQLAFTTIQAAINSAAAGDTVVVPAGVYNESINVNKAINLVCDVPLKCQIVRASISSNAIIDGFYSLNSPSNQGGINGTGSGYKILNNKVEGSCMTAIKMEGSNGLASGNEMLKSVQCAGQSGKDADGIRFFGTGHIIEWNYIHDISYSSVNLTPHIDCFQTWSGAQDTIIRYNICDNATANATLAGSGANLENDNNTLFQNNYFRVAGKVILFETSSTNGKAVNNIMIGAEISNPPPHLYGLFGSNNYTATGNLGWNMTTSNWLLGASSVSGNLKEVDPRMDGYCSLAYPSKGIPCGVSGPTLTPLPPSQVPPPITRSPTVTKTATGSPIPPTVTRTPTFTATPSLTPVSSLTLTPETVTATPQCLDLEPSGRICYFP